MDKNNIVRDKSEQTTLLKRDKCTIFIFSLITHLIVVFAFLRMPIALDDMFQYDMLARSLRSGNGYRWYAKDDVEILKPYLERFVPLDEMTFPEDGIKTAFRSPGYPFFLSAIYLINSSPDRFGLVRIVQAIVFASLSLLVMEIGEIIGLSRKEAIVSGVFISLYPILLFYPIALASENFFIPLFTLAMLIAWKIKQHHSSISLHLLLGLVLGAMILTRSVAVLILVVVFVWLLNILKQKRRLAFISLTIAILLIIPWAVRNSIVMGRPAFIENSFWFNIYIGYHPEGDGNFVSEVAIKPLFITDDAERDDYCKRHAIAFIRNDPLEAVRRVLKRIPAFFGPETRAFNYFYSNNLLGSIPQPWISLIYLLLTVPWFFVCLFGTIGLFINQNRTVSSLAGYSLLFYFLPHLPILTEPRFHLTLVPALIPYSVMGFRRIFSTNFAMKIGKSRKFVIVLIVLFFIIIWAIKIQNDLLLYMQLLAPGGNELGLSY
jgi:4-amino-4-deoxy-L-arabinose transferase-like glycosyltransferase